ncbi:hypothetical protein GOODEAATRI_031762 [Goodea atripinnis]|uniref:Uncharacterized protein n=1 Tax=Goodea atripinnis TaxID=208336 RepID=A0ABV0NF98_9TELE
MKPRMEEVYSFQVNICLIFSCLSEDLPVCAMKTVLEHRSCIPGPHSNCLLCWPDPSQQGAVYCRQQDGDVTKEAQVVARKSSDAPLMLVYTQSRVLSPLVGMVTCW